MFRSIKGFVLIAILTGSYCTAAQAQGPLNFLGSDISESGLPVAPINEQKDPPSPPNIPSPHPITTRELTRPGLSFEKSSSDGESPAEVPVIDSTPRLVPARFVEDAAEESRKMRMLAMKFPRRVNAVEENKEGDDDTAPAAMPQKFHWKPAIYQSLIAQGFQHAYALVAQEKTRRALKGPFFSDYWDSIKGINKWDDGNKFFTNYIAHPMQGSMTGFIYLQNHDRLKRQMFNESKQYWKDRAMALLWSTAWSTNWEIGPISQASIGNVGYYGHGGYVDLVITPTVGTAWMITEEALDRYIIRHAEKNLAARIILRTTLNPTRSVTNLLRFKKPWYRDRAN